MGPTERFIVFLSLCFVHGYLVNGSEDPGVGAYLSVDTSYERAIPGNLMGIFFEEINHAGAGGLWSELVSNRGFEAGGSVVPSNIDPWGVIGDETTLKVVTERSSCFDRNKIALRMESLCGQGTGTACPIGGVGIFNPGFWGMNIVEGKRYKVVFHVRATRTLDLTVAFTDSLSSTILASKDVISKKCTVWTKIELELEANGSSGKAQLQLTTSKPGVIWFDQISAMPIDTFNGHGFRSDLSQMLVDLSPRFMRFPGGCYVEGDTLRNAFRWKETVGPWEERPGHFGDVWGYWTDDGLGFYELLLLAEDIGAKPIWVFNNGISHHDEVDESTIEPFVQEAIDGIEFAVGEANSTWGSLRTAMGHPEPFELQYVTVGNEDCGKRNYKGNYLKFFAAVRKAFPFVKIISNCDLTRNPVDHPADYFEYHRYESASVLFSYAHQFDAVSRQGPKVFASEYAVHGNDAGRGSLYGAIAEAAFLIGIEKNSDLVEMASYAPLFQHVNDRTWTPNAIVFNSTHAYGTPSYWVQQFFIESNGAILHNSTLESPSKHLMASAITWNDPESNQKHLRIKIVNFSGEKMRTSVSIKGKGYEVASGTMTVLKSDDKMDENSLENPNKVVPSRSPVAIAGKSMEIELSPYSLTSVDLKRDSIAPTLPKVSSIYGSFSKYIALF